MKLTTTALLICSCLGGASACADQAVSPAGSGLASADEQPLCQLGCNEQDPNPTAPGVFLGSGVTPDVCIMGGQTDADQDDLGDFCEKNLAFAFAPELAYWRFDDVRREPYWAARPIVDLQEVELGYLFSYYRDAGSQSYPCQLPLAPDSCHGHNGDSEAIFLTVYYNPATQHWVLDHANYSQHGDYPSYSRGSNDYPTMLYYPQHLGSYPQAWVSEGKHANYPSLRECNAGGTLQTDTCDDVDTTSQFETSPYWNIGSRAFPIIDCISSRNPNYEYYSSGRQECYWTLRDFRGWIPDSIGGAEASPYSSILGDFGF